MVFFARDAVDRVPHQMVMVLIRVEMGADDHLISFRQQAAGKLQAQGVALLRRDFICLEGLDKVIALHAALFVKPALYRQHLLICGFVYAAYGALEQRCFSLIPVESIVYAVLQHGLFRVLHIIRRAAHIVMDDLDSSPRHINTAPT